MAGVHANVRDGNRQISLATGDMFIWGQVHTETHQLSPLQWQLMMKCWKMNLRPGQANWWGPTAWRLGAIGLWLAKLRRLNGPHFSWPLLLFAGALPERLMARLGKVYAARPLPIKSRRDLLDTIRPSQWRFLRADTGDMPEMPPPAENPTRWLRMTPQ